MAKRLLILHTALLAVIPQAVYAKSYSMFSGDLNIGAPSGGESNSLSDLSLGVLVSARIRPDMEIEAGYIRSGTLSYTDEDDGVGHSHTHSGTMLQTQAYLVAKPTYSFDFIDLYARLGVNRWDIKNEVTGEGTYKRSGTDLIYGLGFDLHAFNQLSLGFGYTDYDVGNVYEASINFALSESFSLGLSQSNYDIGNIKEQLYMLNVDINYTPTSTIRAL